MFDIILTCVDCRVVTSILSSTYESQRLSQTNKESWEKCDSNINEHYGTTVDLVIKFLFRQTCNIILELGDIPGIHKGTQNNYNKNGRSDKILVTNT